MLANQSFGNIVLSCELSSVVLGVRQQSKMSRQWSLYRPKDERGPLSSSVGMKGWRGEWFYRSFC